MTTLLIDADVICHQLAYKNTRNISFDGEETIEVTQPEKAQANTIEYVEYLMDELKADNALMVLSDRHVNFRKEFEPTYKAQRTKPKPELWHVIRGLIESGDLPWFHAFYPRLEGDDVLGIMATAGSPALGDVIVVSIDKDLQGVPCRLYNPGKPELGLRTISEREAQVFHLWQVLTGDSTDNYKGCPGVGPVAADALVEECEFDAALMWPRIVELYERKKLTEKDAIHQARLAFILQSGDYNIKTNKVKLWTPKRYGIR